MPRFLFLFEIEGEEKENDPDRIISDPLPEALQPVVVQKIVFWVDPDAMIADDLLEVRFHAGDEFVITYVHIQFHTRIRTYPVDII